MTTKPNTPPFDLVWTIDAMKDREKIYDYIEEKNPAAADKMDERFASSATKLTKFPGLGKKGRVAGTQEFVAHHSYIIVFDFDGSRVRILRVLHTSMMWPV